MNIGSAFPSQFLKAADLHKPTTVTIDRVEMEDIGGEMKPVLHFRNSERGLVLNKTNGNIISEVLGTPETDDWSGKRITIFPTKTEFQGKRVACIRVSDQAPAGKQAPPPPPVDPEEEEGPPL